MALAKLPPPTNRGVTKKDFGKAWSGVDYYTATTRKKDIGFGWLSVWNRHRLNASRSGGKVKHFEKFGYKCQVIDSLTFGTSDDFGFLLTASSDVAQETWSRVLPSASNITRLDLQYTFQAKKPYSGDRNIGPLMELYLQLKDSEHSRKRRYDCRENSSGGETMYIGSRQTDQFGRFYNKSEESALEVENIYRLEVEYKKPRSFYLFGRLHRMMKAGSSDALLIRDEVLSWFEAREVIVSDLFRRVEPIAVAKTVSTDAKKFKWLKTSVSPTLVDLADRGLLKELASSLKLTGPQYRQLAMFAEGDENIVACSHELERGMCVKCGQCFT